MHSILFLQSHIGFLSKEQRLLAVEKCLEEGKWDSTGLETWETWLGPANMELYVWRSWSITTGRKSFWGSEAGGTALQMSRCHSLLSVSCLFPKFSVGMPQLALLYLKHLFWCCDCNRSGKSCCLNGRTYENQVGSQCRCLGSNQPLKNHGEWSCPMNPLSQGELYICFLLQKG